MVIVPLSFSIPMSVLLSAILLGICPFHLNLDAIFFYHCSGCMGSHCGESHNLTLLKALQFLCSFDSYCSNVLVRTSLYVCVKVHGIHSQKQNCLQSAHLKTLDWFGHISFHETCPQLPFATANFEMPLFPSLPQKQVGELCHFNGKSSCFFLFYFIDPVVFLMPAHILCLFFYWVCPIIILISRMGKQRLRQGPSVALVTQQEGTRIRTQPPWTSQSEEWVFVAALCLPGWVHLSVPLRSERVGTRPAVLIFISSAQQGTGNTAKEQNRQKVSAPWSFHRAECVDKHVFLLEYQSIKVNFQFASERHCLSGPWEYSPNLHSIKEATETQKGDRICLRPHRPLSDQNGQSNMDNLTS